MIRLVLARHGQSNGNQMHIIQGVEDKYSLTEEGAEHVEQCAERNRKLLQEVTSVYASGLMRAYQTANIMVKTAGNEMKINQQALLNEMNPGVLANCSHSYAEEHYPEYYQIWNARGDLDGIEGAEKGDYLQARVLAFMERYLLSKEQGTHLIVTHAGYLRCAVNTLLGRERTTPINVENAIFHVIEEPWSAMKYNVLKRNSKSLVVMVETANSIYIVKRYTKIFDEFDRENARRQDQIAQKNQWIPKVYWCDNVETEKSKYGVKVLGYMEGEHNWNHLSKDKLKKIVELVINLNQMFNNSKSNFHNPEKHDILYKICSYTEQLQDCRTKCLGMGLLNEQWLQKLSKGDSSQLVLYDLHRENFLFHEDEVSFIDLDSIVLAPRDYQAASFLASFVLLNDPDTEKNELEYCLNEFAAHGYDRINTVKLMVVRLFTGLAYFELLEDKTEWDRETMERYWKAYEALIAFGKENEIVVFHDNLEADV